MEKICSVCSEFKLIENFYKTTKICKQCISIKRKEYYQKNKKHIGIRHKKYYQQNKEKLLFQSKRWKETNKEKVILRYKKWYENNSEQRLISKIKTAKRRGIAQNSNGIFTIQDLTEIYKDQNYQCYYCGTELKDYIFELDHKIPLSRGGTNWPDNLCCTCNICNTAKYNLTEEEFNKHITRIYNHLYQVVGA